MTVVVLRSYTDFDTSLNRSINTNCCACAELIPWQWFLNEDKPGNSVSLSEGSSGNGWFLRKYSVPESLLNGEIPMMVCPGGNTHDVMSRWPL